MRQAPHGMVVRGTRYAPRTKVLLIRTRVSLLRAAVDFALVSPTAPELRLLHRWLDSWSGVGYVVAGMARQVLDGSTAIAPGQADPLELRVGAEYRLIKELKVTGAVTRGLSNGSADWGLSAALTLRF